MTRLTNERSIITPYKRHDPSGQPPMPHEPYKSTVKRSPSQPLIYLPHTLSEITGPVYGHGEIGETDNDLTRQHKEGPQGERIIVTGRVLDSNGRPVPHTLVEIWQANAAGRYVHIKDQHPAPLDPNFTGAGRTITDENGAYRFTTIKPGAYPWFNHYNAWRSPALAAPTRTTMAPTTFSRSGQVPIHGEIIRMHGVRPISIFLCSAPRSYRGS